MTRPGADRELGTDRDRLDAERGGDLTGRPDRDGELTLSEERLRVGTETEHLGTARAVKRVDTETVHARVERGTEHADTERVDVLDAETDSGEVETLPDGSISIPVFEEQIVVTKRLVVRERVVIRKHTVYEDHVVTADLRRERLEVEADAGVVVHDTDGSSADDTRSTPTDHTAVHTDDDLRERT